MPTKVKRTVFDAWASIAVGDRRLIADTVKVYEGGLIESGEAMRTVGPILKRNGVTELSWSMILCLVV